MKRRTPTIESIEKRYETILNLEPRLKDFDVEVRITRKKEASPFPHKEEMLVGWKEIANFLKVSENGVHVMYGAKLREQGVVFFKKAKKGSRVSRCACSFPSLILGFVVRESLRRRSGEKERDELLQQLQRIANGSNGERGRSSEERNVR